MFDIVAMASLAGLAALVVYEIVEEIRGGSSRLHDRYHE
jgi:hypothetical protein